ncbi:MAG: asparagine synthase (glutamine-hydrolyzing) [Pyrinomonadaceae bacterium]|nr:asparagine synthase (glutamine-hydrolyzing) [Pyrinomonadaceae bacterium]
MCGIVGILGDNWRNEDLRAMVFAQRHRGPDGEGIYVDPQRQAGLGHSRLSIIDRSDAGRQPMASADGNLVVTYNGEIYNYLELRIELESDYTFRTQSDTEVLLAAYQKWGEGCLDKLIGMFAFVIWDVRTKSAFAARDRFGVKPFYYHKMPDGELFFASEIKAIHAAGVPRIPNEKAWATYLTYGLYDHSTETFWKDIRSLPGGHSLRWNNGRISIVKWYDLAGRVGDDFDYRPESEVRSEYLELMKDSVKLRFRSDVPVGINLSGGLDSSGLLGLVHEVQGKESDVKAFTFTTGDSNYDELPWVERMLSKTNHPLVVSRLSPGDVPALAESVQFHQDEPFGGLPTLAYAKLFEKAKENGVTVLLDGNGMDEQWAGYDYYLSALIGYQPSLVQGTKESPVRPECLMPEFRALAEPLEFPNVFGDKLRNLQYRDTFLTKIPRAMRFNDRISMRSSTELREPFLDHRLFELAFRQPAERKLKNGTGKVMLRAIVNGLVADGLSATPKRPMQTPQREWLRGELNEWASEKLETAIDGFSGAWLNPDAVRSAFADFSSGKGDNSFFIWQWISLGLKQSRNAATSNTAGGQI